MNIIRIILLLFLIIWAKTIVAQENSKEKHQIDFFLECSDCDFDYVRQELKFVSFVRDPAVAGVHILSSESGTGSGGRKYFLSFIGMNGLAGNNTEYEYLSPPSETDEETRKALLKLIKTGVLHYYSICGWINLIDIDIEKKDEKATSEKSADIWNLWVFNAQAGSSFETEKNQNEYSLTTEISVEKVTEQWKTEIEARYETEGENFYDDDEKIQNIQNQTNISAEYIKSLNKNWSAGIFSEYSSENYRNILNGFRLNLGAEYNIFPWDISNRKVFTLRYTAGLRYYDYNEITIYDKLNETRAYESMSLNLELVQPWGKVELSLEGQHYFHDFSKNRLTLESDISVRLAKQLSVYFEIESELIHDQLYLPKGDASLEDVLLKRRKLATTYEISGNIGIRFTFGSIYNSVVNERF